MRLFFIFLLFPGFLIAQPFAKSEIEAWAQQAKQVIITRDNWGVPHIYGPTDADAVFGMMYAQCEDDFKRVERNYLDALGWMARAYGESYIWHDLRARMFLDSNEAVALYEGSPDWLKQICDSWAAGINYFLHTHPAIQPDYIRRFKPWMPFTFSEGSIGGDITRIRLDGVKAFYGDGKSGFLDPSWSLEAETTGSNGFAIAPEKSKSGSALFLINPHTSFYFRTEQHVQSDEGLNVYGASTWGQFFIYQGFNENCGWMHTSTYADAIDQYRETIARTEEGYFYRYGKQTLPVEEKRVTIPYRDGDVMQEKVFTLYYTHHGPVIRREGESWITFRMMNRPKDALRQSFLRTKANDYDSFVETMAIRTNSSNNTVYADGDGRIAYWHGNFIPKRVNPDLNYNGLVNGSDPNADWDGLLELDEMIHVVDPPNGWIQNCNATPYTVAGTASPSPKDFPDYVAPDRENFRGINAVRVLDDYEAFDLDDLINAANDPTLAAFEKLIPALVEAVRKASVKDDSDIREAIDLLGNWDFHYGEQSIATTLAVYWGERVYDLARSRRTDKDVQERILLDELILRHCREEEMMEALQEAIASLQTDFGDWKTPWGAINRFQRLTGNIQEIYDDNKPSVPVGFTSSRWGSLAAYGTTSPDNVKRRYGRRGNSFVAVVEFGPKLKARAIVSGGQSGNPESPNFTDQAELFCKGQFREVYFYPEQLEGNTNNSYNPGE